MTTTTTIPSKSKQQDKQIGTRPFLILGVNLQHESEEGIGSKLKALPAGQSLLQVAVYLSMKCNIIMN